MLNSQENLSRIVKYKSTTGYLTLAIVNDLDIIRGSCQCKNLGSNLSEDFTVRLSADANIFEALEGLNLPSKLMESIKRVTSK